METVRKGWTAALIPMLLLGVALLSTPAFTEVDDCPDAWITTKVGTRLTFKGMTKIDVSTEECVVTLRGCVKTEEKRKEAVEIAQDTKYVKSVNNKIVLCPDDEDGDDR